MDSLPQVTASQSQVGFKENTINQESTCKLSNHQRCIFRKSLRCSFLITLGVEITTCTSLRLSVPSHSPLSLRLVVSCLPWGLVYPQSNGKLQENIGPWYLSLPADMIIYNMNINIYIYINYMHTTCSTPNKSRSVSVTLPTFLNGRKTSSRVWVRYYSYLMKSMNFQS